MIKTLINFDITDGAWLVELPKVQELSCTVFDKVINEINPEWLRGKKQVSINVALSNDEIIRQLNSEFRNLDKPTNVLSFANIDDEEFDAYLQRNDEIELGDIIISLPTMLEQSDEQGISLHDHYVHILIHGILHILGYDHIEKEETAEMEALEIRLLKMFDIANPYEEN